VSELLDAFRVSTANKVQTIYDRSEKADESTGALILEVMAVINGVTEAQLDPRFRQPTIPLSEVDTRMSGIRLELLDVIGDHEVWKSTFGGLKTRSSRHSRITARMSGRPLRKMTI
jgi:hypothetical protein